METIKTFNYDRPVIEKGYANQTLFIDISVPDISIKPVDDKMKDVFIGGRGFDSLAALAWGEKHDKMDGSG